MQPFDSTARTRSWTTEKPSTVLYNDGNCVNWIPTGSTNHGSFPTTRVEGTTSTITDYNHPDFKKSKAKGGVILGDMVRTYVGRYHQEGSIIYIARNYWCNYYDDLATWVEAAVPAPGLGNVSNDITKAVDIMLIKAYAKMNDTPVLTGEFLSSLDKTVGMMQKPFKGAFSLLAKMAKYKKKTLGKTAASAAKANANAWLEYRYGWKPLIMDGQSIIQSSHKIREMGQKSRLVARSGEKFGYDLTKSFDRVPLLDASCLASGTVHAVRTASVSAGVIYDVRNRTTTEKYARYFGTDAKALPATLWEMIPYSFVVDWFTNVGSWIQAVTPDPHVEIRGNWVTTTDRHVIDYQGGMLVKEWYDSGLHSSSGSWGSSQLVNDRIERSVNRPIASNPVLTGKSLSVLHSVDALALSCGQILAQLSKFK